MRIHDLLFLAILACCADVIWADLVSAPFDKIVDGNRLNTYAFGPDLSGPFLSFDMMPEVVSFTFRVSMIKPSASGFTLSPAPFDVNVATFMYPSSVEGARLRERSHFMAGYRINIAADATINFTSPLIAEDDDGGTNTYSASDVQVISQSFNSIIPSVYNPSSKTISLILRTQFGGSSDFPTFGWWYGTPLRRMALDTLIVGPLMTSRISTAAARDILVLGGINNRQVIELQQTPYQAYFDNFIVRLHDFVASEATRLDLTRSYYIYDKQNQAVYQKEVAALVLSGNSFVGPVYTMSISKSNTGAVILNSMSITAIIMTELLDQSFQWFVYNDTGKLWVSTNSTIVVLSPSRRTVTTKLQPSLWLSSADQLLFSLQSASCVGNLCQSAQSLSNGANKVNSAPSSFPKLPFAISPLSLPFALFLAIAA